MACEPRWPLDAIAPRAPLARRESDEEFRARLLGSDTPQAQRIVTGVDPRLAAAEAEAAEGEDGQAPPAGGGSDTWGTRLDKLADDELSPEYREAKRNTELWKAGNEAKEFGYKWKVCCGTHSHSLTASNHRDLIVYSLISRGNCYPMAIACPPHPPLSPPKLTTALLSAPCSNISLR